MSAKHVAAGCPDMDIPYRARVNERVFLDLPGFHGGAYVLAYVADTAERGLVECDDPTCTSCPRNFEPRIILELADCYRRIEFEFDSEAERANSLLKVDTLLAALRVFRGRASWTRSSSTTGVSVGSMRRASSRARAGRLT